MHGVTPKVTWLIPTQSRSNPFRVVAKDKDQRQYRDGPALSGSGGGAQRHGHGGYRQQTPYDRPGSGGGARHYQQQQGYPPMYPPPQMMMYPGGGNRGGRGDYYGGAQGGYPPRGGNSGGYGRR